MKQNVITEGERTKYRQNYHISFCQKTEQKKAAMRAQVTQDIDLFQPKKRKIKRHSFVRGAKIEVNALRRHTNNHTTRDANIDLRSLIDSPLLVLVASVRSVRFVALLENRRFFAGRRCYVASTALIGRYMEPVD